MIRRDVVLKFGSKPKLSHGYISVCGPTRQNDRVKYNRQPKQISVNHIDGLPLWGMRHTMDSKQLLNNPLSGPEPRDPSCARVVS